MRMGAAIAEHVPLKVGFKPEEVEVLDDPPDGLVTCSLMLLLGS
jgi:hypothetical protein